MIKSVSDIRRLVYEDNVLDNSVLIPKNEIVIFVRIDGDDILIDIHSTKIMKECTCTECSYNLACNRFNKSNELSYYDILNKGIYIPKCLDCDNEVTINFSLFIKSMICRYKK